VGSVVRPDRLLATLLSALTRLLLLLTRLGLARAALLTALLATPGFVGRHYSAASACWFNPFSASSERASLVIFSSARVASRSLTA